MSKTTVRPTDNTFPYLEFGNPTRTDGVILGTNLNTTVYLPGPNGVNTRPPRKRGEMVPYIGNTSTIDTNTVAHNVLAGND